MLEIRVTWQVPQPISAPRAAASRRAASKPAKQKLPNAGRWGRGGLTHRNPLGLVPPRPDQASDATFLPAGLPTTLCCWASSPGLPQPRRRVGVTPPESNTDPAPVQLQEDPAVTPQPGTQPPNGTKGPVNLSCSGTAVRRQTHEAGPLLRGGRDAQRSLPQGTAIDTGPDEKPECVPGTGRGR